MTSKLESLKEIMRQVEKPNNFDIPDSGEIAMSDIADALGHSGSLSMGEAADAFGMDSGRVSMSDFHGASLRDYRMVVGKESGGELYGFKIGEFGSITPPDWGDIAHERITGSFVVTYGDVVFSATERFMWRGYWKLAIEVEGYNNKGEHHYARIRMDWWSGMMIYALNPDDVGAAHDLFDFIKDAEGCTLFFDVVPVFTQNVIATGTILGSGGDDRVEIINIRDVTGNEFYNIHDVDNDYNQWQIEHSGHMFGHVGRVSPHIFASIDFMSHPHDGRFMADISNVYYHKEFPPERAVHRVDNVHIYFHSEPAGPSGPPSWSRGVSDSEMTHDEVMEIISGLQSIYGADMFVSGGAARTLREGGSLAGLQDLDMYVHDTIDNIKRLVENRGGKYIRSGYAGVSDGYCRSKFNINGLTIDIVSPYVLGLYTIDIAPLYSSNLQALKYLTIYWQDGEFSQSLDEYMAAKEALTPNTPKPLPSGFPRADRKGYEFYLKRKNLDLGWLDCGLFDEVRPRHFIIIDAPEMPAAHKFKHHYVLKSQVEQSRYLHLV
ncbi:hypothetical protein [Thaumasiovibrio sp. DFM-14]|uniref:hypothetical protein n=1 Tax=Thaumasiovibrio sp. DFM-14 TaxID=3384792 RepID=UPI0039A21748